MFKNLFDVLIRLLVGSILLLSCSEKQAGHEEATISKKEDTLLSDEHTLVPQEELAPVPRVVRPAVSPGRYGYNADTTQVSQYIRQIFQDKKGDLWFGTVGDGVCKYDGETLTYFTPKEGFAGTSVQKILEDRSGNLWFGTESGLSKYDGTKFINYTKKNGLISDHIFTLLEDNNGKLWIGTNEGVCFASKQLIGDTGKLFKPYLFPGAIQKPEVRSIIQAQNGNMWFATSGQGIYRFSGHSLLHLSGKDGLSHQVVFCLVQDDASDIWCATDGGGISRYDASAEFIPGAALFTNYLDEKGDNRVTTLYKDRSGSIWSSVRASVRHYNSTIHDRSLQMRTFKAYSSADGLNNCCVQSFLEDRAGNLWIGSGVGLSRIDRSRENHPCVKKTCGHDLQNKLALKAHELELSKTIVNVTKNGPWPKRFR